MNEITSEIARIHAHLCGDGCVYLKKEKRSLRSLIKHPRKQIYENVWVIEYTNKKRKLLEEFNQDLKTAFNRKGQWRPKYSRIQVSSVKWIVDFLQLRGKNSYNWFIPHSIMSANKNIIAMWIRAFFDDEATVTDYGAIRVKCMNQNGLKQIRDLLSIFKIRASLTGPNSDNSYYLYIYKKYNVQYQENIGFLHPEKREKLQKLKKMGPP